MVAAVDSATYGEVDMRMLGILFLILSILWVMGWATCNFLAYYEENRAMGVRAVALSFILWPILLPKQILKLLRW